MGPNSCAKLQLAPGKTGFIFLVAVPPALVPALSVRGVQINPAADDHTLKTFC